MQHTPNYNLNKPEGNDYAKIESLNVNADTIDAELKRISDAIGNGGAGSDILSRLNALETKVGNLNDLETTKKTNLVAAINEVRQNLMAHINDNNKHLQAGERADWTNKMSSFTNASDEDPNTTTKTLILTNHANAAFPSSYTYVRTVFYGNGAQKSQIATTHWGTARMAYRSCVADVWTPWMTVLNQDDYNTLFQSVSNGKATVNQAVTDMGQPTAPDATFETTAANIRKLGNTVIGSGALVRNGTSVRVSGTTPNMMPSAIIVLYNNTANRGRTVYWEGVGNQETVSYMLDGVSAIKEYPSTINRWNGGFTIDIPHPNANGGYSFIAVK